MSRERPLEVSSGARDEGPSETAALTIEGSCGIETSTPPASTTPSPTFTPVAPSPTVTASPSPTPQARDLYLPIAYSDQCLFRDRPVDVVLLIDASLSMQSQTRAGRSKLDAAKDGLHCLRTADCGRLRWDEFVLDMESCEDSIHQQTACRVGQQLGADAAQRGTVFFCHCAVECVAWWRASPARNGNAQFSW